MSAARDHQTKPKPFELLLAQDAIAHRITELGHQITRDYAGRTPVLIGVLKGCIIFIADLMRVIKLPLEIEFVAAESYQTGMQPGDTVKLDKVLGRQFHGRHVLIVEGIVDSGRTVTTIMKQLEAVEPASVEVVTLIDKPASHRRKLKLKYVGFSLGNEFVIGFGLDNTQRYRNLPFIGRMLED